MIYSRQEGILNMKKVKNLDVTIIGAGATGSFSALGLAKMGVGNITVFDEDGVSEHNLPNQFYRHQDINQFKVDALKEIIHNFSEATVRTNVMFYEKEKLSELVIVCTDSLDSRKRVWEQFLKQPQTKYYIDSRMGGEMAHLFIVKEKSKKLIDFYSESLKVKPEQLPCSERSIIYCVMMIASIIGRAVKSIVENETDFPYEVIFGMRPMIYMDNRGEVLND